MAQVTGASLRLSYERSGTRPSDRWSADLMAAFETQPCAGTIRAGANSGKKQASEAGSRSTSARIAFALSRGAKQNNGSRQGRRSPVLRSETEARDRLPHRDHLDAVPAPRHTELQTSGVSSGYRVDRACCRFSAATPASQAGCQA